MRKTGALVGIHCCGDAGWERILPLGFDVLSIDAGISLRSVLARREELAAFERAGGLLALGVVPTDRAASTPEPEALVAQLRSALAAAGRETLATRALLTPACGLALRTVTEAEEVFAGLSRVRGLLGVRSPSSASSSTPMPTSMPSGTRPR